MSKNPLQVCQIEVEDFSAGAPKTLDLGASS
jgi:hypothetical protein